MVANGLGGVFAVESLVTRDNSTKLKAMEAELLASAAIRAVTDVAVPFVVLILLLKDRRKGGLQITT